MKNFLQILWHSRRVHYALMLTVSIAFSMMLLAYRVHFSDTVTYLFLGWNLFLVFIPFVISSFLVMKAEKISKLALVLLIGAWLTFFPNAPYIITDLFHLGPRQNVPIWYDLMLIVSFCWNGLILTFISLADVHQVLNKMFNKFVGWSFVLASLFLTGFGVYVGRYLRWNSWDVLTNPTDLAMDVLHRFVYPGAHPKTWGFTIVFSAFLFISYMMMRQLMRRERNA